jgi:predicted ATPase
LDPLNDTASRELAEQLLAVTGLTNGAVRVADIAEGNPLFIEELAASIAESSTTDELPTSVRALIAARLDSLPPEERSVLVDASVAGRVFWRGALLEMSHRDGLSELLGSLEARDLILREAVSRIRGDQQFAFKHALIHDVAYKTLPRAGRRERHAAVARFLEATTAAGQSHEALAHHWREAGEVDNAVEHLIAAADQAGRGWAKQRAVALYREALELLPESDPRRRDLTLRLAVALQAVYHLPDVGEQGARAPSG